jgi:hypothetical protein
MQEDGEDIDISDDDNIDEEDNEEGKQDEVRTDDLALDYCYLYTYSTLS